MHNTTNILKRNEELEREVTRLQKLLQRLTPLTANGVPVSQGRAEAVCSPPAPSGVEGSPPAGAPSVEVAPAGTNAVGTTRIRGLERDASNAQAPEGSPIASHAGRANLFRDSPDYEAIYAQATPGPPPLLPPLHAPRLAGTIYGVKIPDDETLITPEQVGLICRYLECGTSRKSAFAMAGLSYSRPTTVAMLQQGVVGRQPYATLVDLMELAEARCEHRMVKRWEAHTADSWQAASAFLRARFPNEWGETLRIDLTVQQLAQLSMDELLEVVGPELRPSIEAEFRALEDSEAELSSAGPPSSSQGDPTEPPATTE